MVVLIVSVAVLMLTVTMAAWCVPPMDIHMRVMQTGSLLHASQTPPSHGHTGANAEVRAPSQGHTGANVY